MSSASRVWQPSSASHDVTVRNVLVPTDFSDFSDCSARAVNAIGVADRDGANLHLFHCVNPTPFKLAEDPEAVHAACDDVRRDLERLALNLSSHRTRNCDVKAVVSAGNVADILPQAVKDLDLGLIIVGTHGRTAGKTGARIFCRDRDWTRSWVELIR